MPTRTAIAYPGLNAGACAHHGVNSRLINDSFNKSQHPKFPYWLTIGVFRGETGYGTWGYAKSKYQVTNCLSRWQHSPPLEWRLYVYTKGLAPRLSETHQRRRSQHCF